MIHRATEFALGGFLILASLIPLGIGILGGVPTFNLGLIFNFGGIGLVLGLFGFYLVGDALFRSE